MFGLKEHKNQNSLFEITRSKFVDVVDVVDAVVVVVVKLHEGVKNVPKKRSNFFSVFFVLKQKV